MINLLRAEWKKNIWNYKLTGFLVWGYPVGIFGFYAVMLLSGLVSRDFLEGMITVGAGSWTSDALGVWGLVLAFPFTVLARLLPLSFMAAVFAGEYQSGMWKNLIPRNRRAYLILAKLAVVVALLSLSLVASSALSVGGQGVSRLLVGKEYGPALTADTVGDFLLHYGQTILLGVLSLVILAGMAALAAILTRSVLGALLVAFGFSTLDSLSMFVIMLFTKIFSWPGLADLYRFFPQCNLDNAQSWFQTGAAMRLPFDAFPIGPSLTFSLGMLAVWAVGITLIVLAVFQRQDIAA